MLDKVVLEDLDRIIKSLELHENPLEGSSVLVTGGAGFIGSYTCDALIKLGSRVTCVDNFSGGRIENIDHLLEDESFKLIRADVSVLNLQERFDCIMHMASPAAPEEYQQRPVETMLANSLGTLNILELARKSDAVVLYTSTSEVYGDARVVPTPEAYWGNANPIGPRSCYDESKRFSEALLMAYMRQHGLDVRTVRIFNTYGPRMRADGIYGRVIPRFIRQALSGEPITVYGRGTQTRSFCYISDTVEGIIRAVLREEARGEVINIGNPQEITIIRLAMLIKRVTGSKSKVAFKKLPADDPRRRAPDITKAKRILKWRPKVGLMDGLRRTVEWFRMERG